jgi:ankyrin repeat protein
VDPERQPAHVTELADRFVDLACLSYDERESLDRRREAEALLARAPELVAATLHAAAAVGDLAGVTDWLDRDPALAIRSGGPRNWPPLLSLCYCRVLPARPGWDPLATARILLARGADANANTKIGGNYLFTAITGAIGEGEAGPVLQAPHPQARALVELLLEAGANPDDGQALYNTHFNPANDWLELLIAHGLTAAAGPVNWNPSGPSTLDYLLGQAAQQGFTDRVRLLLAHGARPDGRNYYNRRPHLDNALLEGHTDIAELLAKAGAAPAELTPAEAFRAAVLRADEPEARRLLAAHPEAAADPGTLAAAARHGKLPALRLALDLGLPIDAAPHDGKTALHAAAQAGQLAAAKELVARGAALDLRDPVYGGTPIGHANHFAERWPARGCAEIREFLLAHTRDPFDLVNHGARERLQALAAGDPALARLERAFTLLEQVYANDPNVKLQGFSSGDAPAAADELHIVVELRQVDQQVRHAYRIAGGQVTRMDVLPGQ